MFMTTLDCKEKGLHFSSVHDSYWTHAGTMETMNASLREQFVDLYSQPILEDLLALLEMRFPLLDFPPVPQRGELDLELVKKSEYFFA
jgi:DNA-directed RNA polymerase